MENATQALMMAFAVFIFIIALSLSMLVFGKAKDTSDKVFYMSDETNFYERVNEDEKLPIGRIVSGETIIPTLYRYYKENFNVLILDKNFNQKAVYNLEEEVSKFNKNRKDAPWLGNANVDAKLRIDLDLSAEKGIINGETYTPQTSKDGVGLLEYLNKHKFHENFLEQRYSGKEITSEDNETLEIVKGNPKLWIIYQEV